MAGADRRHCPHAAAAPDRNADQDDGSDCGCLGGAAQTTQHCRAIGHAEQNEIRLARWLAGWRCLSDGGNKPIAVLDDIRGAVAESLDRYDDNVDQGGATVRSGRHAPALSTGAANGARACTVPSSRMMAD